MVGAAFDVTAPYHTMAWHACPPRLRAQATGLQLEDMIREYEGRWNDYIAAHNIKFSCSNNILILADMQSCKKARNALNRIVERCVHNSAHNSAHRHGGESGHMYAVAMSSPGV